MEFIYLVSCTCSVPLYLLGSRTEGGITRCGLHGGSEGGSIVFYVFPLLVANEVDIMSLTCILIPCNHSKGVKEIVLVNDARRSSAQHQPQKKRQVLILTIQLILYLLCSTHKVDCRFVQVSRVGTPKQRELACLIHDGSIEVSILSNKRTNEFGTCTMVKKERNYPTKTAYEYLSSPFTSTFPLRLVSSFS
jgi:hypothetical protein